MFWFYWQTLLIITILHECECIDPQLQRMTRNDLIAKYFSDGYAYVEILQFLVSYHQISMSLRHLNRILRSLGLFRRHNKSSLNEVILTINKLLQGSFSSVGYRFMHQKLRSLGVMTDKETVRLCLLNLDPDGVERRRSRKLQRRVYTSRGPDFTWHIDGYDKLKPYGFAIHGAIDGYSRKILWLAVGNTNNNPNVVASYYHNTLKEFSRIPQVVRADRGSENIVIGGIQRFLRRGFGDNLSGDLSFRYGPSTSNQRIEAWWSQFRKAKGTWWINLFKDLVSLNILDISLNYHLQVIRFCFMGIIQKELDDMKYMWNTHYIREVKNSECPSGRPNVLYYMPEMSNGRKCSFPISRHDIQEAQYFCHPSSLIGCTEEYRELISSIMINKGLQLPVTADEAKQLFVALVNEIELLV